MQAPRYEISQATTKQSRIFEARWTNDVTKTRRYKANMLALTDASRITYMICMPKVNCYNVSHYAAMISLGASYLKNTRNIDYHY